MPTKLFKTYADINSYLQEKFGYSEDISTDENNFRTMIDKINMTIAFIDSRAPMVVRSSGMSPVQANPEDIIEKDKLIAVKREIVKLQYLAAKSIGRPLGGLAAEIEQLAKEREELATQLSSLDKGNLIGMEGGNTQPRERPAKPDLIRMEVRNSKSGELPTLSGNFKIQKPFSIQDILQDFFKLSPKENFSQGTVTLPGEDREVYVFTFPNPETMNKFIREQISKLTTLLENPLEKQERIKEQLRGERADDEGKPSPYRPS